MNSVAWVCNIYAIQSLVVRILMFFVFSQFCLLLQDLDKLLFHFDK